jgi:hypothetical protein
MYENISFSCDAIYKNGWFLAKKCNMNKTIKLKQMLWVLLKIDKRDNAEAPRVDPTKLFFSVFFSLALS